MFSRGIVAAMEDEAQAAELAIDDAGSESMEASMVDVVDMSADIETGTSEMTQTVSDADQLERHVEVLTDAEGEGGASPELVEATEIAVESIYARLGIYGATGIPALEAFSTKTGRARATRIAIEDIKGKIKQIWEAVKSAFVKLVNFVKDFFGKLMDTKKKVMARITSLEVKVKSLKGKPAKDKVSGKGVGSVFGANAETTISGTLESIKKDQSADFVKEMLNNIGPMTIGVGNQQNYDAFNITPKSGESVSGSAPEDMKWTFVETFGTSDLVCLYTKEKQTGKAAYKAVAAAKFKMVKSTKVSESDSELAALEAPRMNSLLKEAREALTTLMNGKITEQTMNVALDKAIADINRVVALASKEDETIGDRAAVVRSAVTSSGSNAISAAALIQSNGLRCVQATLTYVERSISNFSEEAKKD